jgi:hypothetical protein
MTRRWPDSLPVPVGRGYRLDLADQARRSEFETAIRARRITAVRRDRPTLAARLTDAEFAAFRAWWGDEAWSIGGSSDSLAAWTPAGVTIQPGAAMGLDLVSCDVLAENGDNSAHYVQLVPNVGGWGPGERIFVTVTLAGLTRTAARISLIGRDDITRAAIADLATGVVTAEHADVVARGEPNLGWTRVVLSAPVGSGTEPLPSLAWSISLPVEARDA